MAVYELNENNSGGSFWLNRKNYDALLAAGWYIQPSESSFLDDNFGADDREGGHVPYSWRHGLRVEANSLQEAVEQFESITGQDFFAEGCNCCGAPFSMYLVTDDGRDYSEYVSGDSVSRQVIRPW